ncbi:MAG TPA: YSC84-related protein [Gemmatimonadaceae bacterium]|jgi:lipid-binding SYLF domain-containing protein|nr:YSC84-related protein [Gemmatimonadaceae bacterium]
MRSVFVVLASLFPLMPLSTSPLSTAPVVTTHRRGDLDADVQETIKRVKLTDPGLQRFFDNSVGYAVFPGIAKGGMGIGAAHGDGELIEHGRVVGRCSMTQVNVGLQLGGQVYSELLFFETKDAIDAFKQGHFTFAAQASAVAVASGASANAKYRSAVAVFTQAKGGLMYEASIGGQKFSFTPISS